VVSGSSPLKAQKSLSSDGLFGSDFSKSDDDDDFTEKSSEDSDCLASVDSEQHSQGSAGLFLNSASDEEDNAEFSSGLDLDGKSRRGSGTKSIR
jgi:hypothetical protein